MAKAVASLYRSTAAVSTWEWEPQAIVDLVDQPGEHRLSIQWEERYGTGRRSQALTMPYHQIPDLITELVGIMARQLEAAEAVPAP